MKKCNSCSGGFTLIEVVISLAVIALALVSIMGLLAVFLTGNKDALDRQEALEVCQPLNSYLRNQGFETVYKWLQPASSATPSPIPLIYAFNVPLDQNGNPTAPPVGAPAVYVISSSDTINFPNLATDYSYSTGRLYYISLAVSTNVPYHIGVAQTPMSYTGSALPISDLSSGPTDTGFYADASLSISVRVYAVPPPPFVVQSAAVLEKNHNYPLLTYDTIINR